MGEANNRKEEIEDLKEKSLTKTQIIVDVDVDLCTCKGTSFIGLPMPPAVARKVLLDAAETLLEMRLQDIVKVLVKHAEKMLTNTKDKDDFKEKIMEK